MKLIRLLSLLLLATPALAGIHFDGSSNATAIVATAEATTTPLTVCAYVRPATNTNNYGVFAVTDNVLNVDQFLMYLDSGGLVQTLVSHGGAAFASTKGTYAANVWQIVCSKWVSNISRTAHLNGIAGTTNTGSNAPSGIIATGVGSRPATIPDAPFNGDIAEVGVWDVDLSGNDFGMLHSGYAPSCINRSHLLSYYQMLAKNGSSLPDFFGNTHTNLTLGSGTSTATSHPVLIYCQ